MNDLLADSIRKRTAANRFLSLDLDKLSRSVDMIYSTILPEPVRALYIGVGHGHDAVLALLDGKVKSVAGVDPYIDSHGNSEDDYRELLSLITANKLEERFTVFRESIQDFLAAGYGGAFDLIMANDVLHHIFTTEKVLLKSGQSDEAIRLFRLLYDVANPGGTLVIGEVRRHGPLPLLANLGLLRNSSMNYRTKQSWQQWSGAASKAGWKLMKMNYYVPYALRRLNFILSTPIFGPLACKRYFIYLKKEL